MVSNSSSVAHINNPAGVAGTFASEQRKQGSRSEVFVFNERSSRFFPEDGVMVTRYNPLAYLKFVRKLMAEFDLWHYHYPYGRMWKVFEKLGVFERARKAGKSLLYHFHGSDLRARGRYDGFCLVSTPDLLARAPQGKWLPNPLPLDIMEGYYRGCYERNNPVPKVLYFPDFDFKRDVADYVSKPLKELQAAGKCYAYPTMNYSRANLLATMASCDVVVGKIRPDMGWFGKFALEAMSLGVPVIAYVSDELYDRYRPPVYRTTKDTFKQDLEYLLQDSQTRHRLAVEGRRYVRAIHDSRVIAGTLKRYYATADEMVCPSL